MSAAASSSPSVWRRAELASGVLVFGDGPSPLEVGLTLELGLSLDVTEYFVARVAVGLAPVADRHGLSPLFQARAEGALQGHFGGIVSLLGAGRSLPFGDAQLRVSRPFH
ncbi:MAG: hypothetical protein JWN48_4767 [Myxococcaceae bacterium]|nr:hypothetical protein [Myxococcaceae bacterium]